VKRYPVVGILLWVLFLFWPPNAQRVLASEPAAATSGQNSGVDRFLRRAADILTDMDGPVGRVYFPAIATNPNSGPTFGILPVWLLTNDRHQIEHIFAPMLTYNQTFGPAFSGSYFYYPSGRTKLRILLEKASKSNHRGAVNFETLEFMDDRCVLRIDLNYEADGALRFFGFGPASSKLDEASYRLIERLAQAEVGVKYWGVWQAAVGWKYRYTDVEPGIVSTPRVLDPKIQTASAFSNPTFKVFRDTRDLPSTPAQGSFTEIFGEFSDRVLGSGSTYQRYGGRWSLYAPNSKTLTTAVHVRGDWSQGGQVPFTALSSLGGPTSLRGFAAGRFQDRGSLLFNLEERWTFHRLGVINALAEFQIAPFLDVGTVFSDMAKIQAKRLQPVVGVAFRAVVKPSVVGKIEIGAGKEGPATFVGIDYPF